MYQKMYATLFNAVTKALQFLSEGDQATAKWLLEEAQRETENIFMEWDWEKKDPSDKDPDGPHGPAFT